MEHTKSLRPSTIVTVYLFATVLCDIVRVRSVWLVDDRTLGITLSCTLALELVTLLLELMEKQGYHTESDKKQTPEEFAGMFNRSAYWWLNHLIRYGFTTTLSPADLYEMEERMNASVFNTIFQSVWIKHKLSKPSKSVLLKTLSMTLWAKVLLPVPVKLAQLALLLCQPLALNRVLSFLQSDESENVGYALIGAYAIIYLGIAIFGALYGYYKARFIAAVRCTLVIAIYGQTMSVALVNASDSAALTLMSTDVGRVCGSAGMIHEIWANILQLGIATWLLQRQIGLVCLAPVVISTILAICTMWVSSRAGPRQGAWMQKLSLRINDTSTLLLSLKSAKLTGIVQQLANRVLQLRHAEVITANGFRKIVALAITFAFTPSIIAPPITFAIQIATSSSAQESLSLSKIFTSLSLILLMTGPLSSLFQNIPNVLGSFASIRRIQAFLLASSSPDAQSIPKSTHTLPNEKAASSEQKGGEVNETSGQNFIASIRDGTFGWATNANDSSPVLRDVNIEIHRGGLTLIRGPVASGKSTLLAAILGETAQATGSVTLGMTSTAYCNQTVWLQNKSIRSNVIVYLPFDAEWYSSVIEAVALKHDLQYWPEGDETVVGSNGAVLSGGQKRRVAMARAVYARKSVSIFDDSFTGLDATTERSIALNLFGPQGLLRRSAEATSIVVGHSETLTAMANSVITLSVDGRIVSQEHNRQIEYPSAASAPPECSNGGEEAGTSVEKPIISKDNDQTQKPVGDISAYMFYFRALGWRAAALFMLFQVTFGFFQTFPSVWLNWWATALDSGDKRIGYFLGIYSALQVFAVLSIFVLCWHTLTGVISKAGLRLHNLLLTTVINATLLFISSTDSGTILNRFSQDIELIDGQFPEALLDFFATAFMCLGQMALIASSSWYIAFSYPIIIAVVWFIQRYYLRTSRQLRLLDLEAKSPLYTHFRETLAGLATIRAFGWQKESIQVGMKHLDDSQKPYYLLLMIQQWLSLVLDLTVAGLALILISLSVVLRKSGSTGFTAVGLVSLISFNHCIKVLVQYWTQMETSLGALARIKRFSEEVVSESSVGTAPSGEWPSTGHIKLTNASVNYKGYENFEYYLIIVTDTCYFRSGANELDNISLYLTPGQRLAVCGRSGSGKSTLVSALMRLVELHSGTITIDGVDIKTVPHDVLRTKVVVVSQDACLFGGTVRFNVDPYGTSSDEEISAALRKVSLTEAVESLGGLDGEVKPESLAQGQIQLFNLVRAI